MTDLSSRQQFSLFPTHYFNHLKSLRMAVHRRAHTHVNTHLFTYRAIEYHQWTLFLDCVPRRHPTQLKVHTYCSTWASNPGGFLLWGYNSTNLPHIATWCIIDSLELGWNTGHRWHQCQMNSKFKPFLDIYNGDGNKRTYFIQYISWAPNSPIWNDPTFFKYQIFMYCFID